MKYPTITFSVLGKRWKARIMTREGYFKKHGQDSVAIALCYKKRIDFGPYINRETVTHELVHAYFEELCIRSTNMRESEDDFEEFCADMIAKYSKDILELSDIVYTRLKELLK